MSTKACPNCKRSLSLEASICPECGHPQGWWFQRTGIPWWLVGLVGLGLFFLSRFLVDRYM
jgi:ssDNA-binding Zn-finger/Zn-ribbon topoisomerase 1